jgi:predicted permease
METLWQDARYAGRMLGKNPGFIAVVVVTLALGIGANATIFSLVNALLLRPLPAERPEEIVAVYTSDFSGPRYGASSYPDYLDFREKNDALEGLVAYTLRPLNLAVRGTNERIFAELVSGNYFSLLGIRPALGRGFLPEEDRTPGRHPVVVLSHGLWTRRFGADASLVGRLITLNGEAFTVVGVAPEGYGGMIRGLGVEAWVPTMMEPKLQPNSRDIVERSNRGFLLLGRLKTGATVEQAQARFNVIARQLHQAFPQAWTDVRDQRRAVTVLPEYQARIFPGARGPVLGFLALLMVVAGLVLLVACANVANLLLSRAAARRREMAIRLSLGAGRGRLIRQLLTESILLALVAGSAGTLLALWGTDLLTAFQPPVPIPVQLSLSLDGRVLAFALLLSLLTGVLFGLAPALGASRPDLVQSLKDDASGSGGASRSRLRRAFVVAQVSLSLLLLIGSGLFLRSLRNASTLDPGFDAENLLLLSMDLEPQGYTRETGPAFYQRLLERARAVPGVEAATLATELPLGLGASRMGLTIEGYTRQPGEDAEVHGAFVGPGYFETLRIPLLRGRGFTDQDRQSAPGVAAVNEAFAQRYWPGQDALGKRLQLGVGVTPEDPAWEVVGVVKTGKYVTLGEEPRPFFYMPVLQVYRPSATLLVRAAGGPARALPAVRTAVQELDRSLPLFDVKTMEQHLGTTLLPARLAGAVLGLFGGVALLLAAVGIYGVMAYAVAQRTREIGIRMALGARPADVLRLVIAQGMGLTLVGMAIGLAAAFGVTRFLASLLYGLSPTDPVTFLGVSLLLAGAAFLACYLPARRAMRVDPAIALRYE